MACRCSGNASIRAAASRMLRRADTTAAGIVMGALKTDATVFTAAQAMAAPPGDVDGSGVGSSSGRSGSRARSTRGGRQAGRTGRSGARGLSTGASIARPTDAARVATVNEEWVVASSL